MNQELYCRCCSCRCLVFYDELLAPIHTACIITLWIYIFWAHFSFWENWDSPVEWGSVEQNSHMSQKHSIMILKTHVDIVDFKILWWTVICDNLFDFKMSTWHTNILEKDSFYVVVEQNVSSMHYGECTPNSGHFSCYLGQTRFLLLLVSITNLWTNTNE